MPDEVNRGQVVQLVLLILIVPLQLLLSRTSDENWRQYQIDKVLNDLSSLSDKYLNWQVWVSWCGNLLNVLKGKEHMIHPPKEVLETQNSDGHFAMSTVPRSPRPPNVSFRVGQVVKHNSWGYKGIIIGWDSVAKAPDKWLKEMHPTDKPHWRSVPNYAVLVDTRDRLTPQMAYVVEENLEVITNTRVMHPMIDHYFEHFDGAQYIPRPWLRKVYPHD